MKHHFAHSTKNKESFACLESAFHTLVVSILAEQKSCLLALHHFNRPGIDLRVPGAKVSTVSLTSLGQQVEVLSVDQDFSIDRVRPDVSLSIDTGRSIERVFVEVFSNRAFLRKRAKRIEKHDISVLEICFDGFDSDAYTLDDVAVHLANVANYAWFSMSAVLKRWAESSWHERWFDNPWQNERRQAFLADIDSHCKANGVRLPRFPGYGKQYGYYDLGGAFVETEFLGGSSPEPVRTCYGVCYAEPMLLELKIGASENPKSVFVSLDYYGLHLDPQKSIFLRSIHPEYPSGADFVAGLTWGRQDKLSKQVSNAEDGVRRNVKIMLLEEINRIRVMMDGVAGAVDEDYRSRFDRRSGVYVNIGPCKHLFGVNQLEFQDAVLSSMQRRKEFSVKSVIGDCVTSSVQNQSFDPEEIARRIDLVRGAYQLNQIKIGMVDEALLELDQVTLILRAEDYVARYMEWGLENGLFAKVGEVTRSSLSYDDIASVIANHGVWTMAIDPQNPATRFD
ncbi:hypothetical protein RYA05_05935 [Pseudomonas syringae pv. actinidiae]|nr:hypothetical protein [Pseudomonas syringae pv. actinidiae]